MIFLTLLALPLILAGAGFVFLKGITLLEFAAQAAAQLLVAGVSMAIVSCSNTCSTSLGEEAATVDDQQDCPQCGAQLTCFEHTVHWSWGVEADTELAESAAERRAQN